VNRGTPDAFNVGRRKRDATRSSLIRREESGRKFASLDLQRLEMNATTGEHSLTVAKLQIIIGLAVCINEMTQVP